MLYLHHAWQAATASQCTALCACWTTDCSTSPYVQHCFSQVGDLAWSTLAALRWPTGQHVMKAEEAVRLVTPYVTAVTLDVKTYQDRYVHIQYERGPHLHVQARIRACAPGCRTCLQDWGFIGWSPTGRTGGPAGAYNKMPQLHCLGKR